MTVNTVNRAIRHTTHGIKLLGRYTTVDEI